MVRTLDQNYEALYEFSNLEFLESTKTRPNEHLEFTMVLDLHSRIYFQCCGNMPPEYAVAGIFSEKSSVFSFGVMLLEIVSSKNTSFHCHE